MGNLKNGIRNLDLDNASQIEFNRQKNEEQDNAIATLSSQVQQIISQRPSGFLSRTYYGLTRGAQTYRFLADAVINITGISGNVGDAFEFVSVNETQNYISGVAIYIGNEQVRVAIQGDYDIAEDTFNIVNMRDGTMLSNVNLGAVLAQQLASYLGDYDAQTNADKQVTVLYDLESGQDNVIYASVDFNNDDIYNWIRIGGYSNGIDGVGVYTVTSATASSVFSAVKLNDSVIAGESFTYDGNSFNIGDVFSVDALSPLTLTAKGNVRGAKGDTGDTGSPGANGQNGYTPYIQDGNWYINGTDTGVQAVGINGTNGQNGQAFNMQSSLYSTDDNWGQAGNTDPDGNPLLQLPTLPQVDISGKGYVVYDPLTTPLYPFYDLYYANNGDNDWTIIHPFSGIAGTNGQNGYTPYIQGGQWFINGVNTGVNATGPQGPAGPTPVITGAATVDNNTGIPAVSVVKTGTDSAPTLTFNFTNIKGATGNTGPTGATPNISATATQLPEGSAPTVSTSGTPENPILAFGIPKGDTGDGFPSGGTTGQYLIKTSNSDYDTEWHSLGSADIIGALQYTPYNSANPSGYIAPDANGDVLVPTTPTSNNGATSKSYVDLVEEVLWVSNPSTGNNIALAKPITDYKNIYISCEDTPNEYLTMVIPLLYITDTNYSKKYVMSTDSKYLTFHFVDNQTIYLDSTNITSWLRLWILGTN